MFGAILLVALSLSCRLVAAAPADLHSHAGHVNLGAFPAHTGANAESQQKRSQQKLHQKHEGLLHSAVTSLWDSIEKEGEAKTATRSAKKTFAVPRVVDRAHIDSLLQRGSLSSALGQRDAPAASNKMLTFSVLLPAHAGRRRSATNRTFAMVAAVPSPFGDTMLGLAIDDEESGLSARGEEGSAKVREEVLLTIARLKDADGRTHVHVSVRDGPRYVHRLHTHADGSMTMKTVDKTQFPDEEDPVAQEVVSEAVNAHAAETSHQRRQANQTGIIVDVGLVYTPQAVTLFSLPLIQLEGVSATAELSSYIYPMSQIDITLRVCLNSADTVGSLNETAAGDQGTLRSTFASTYGTVRTNSGCDLMACIYSSSSWSSFCGQGNLPGAWTVTAANCVKDNYSYAHELGHNFGAYHGPTPTPRVGYGDATNDFRTVMAYGSICGSGACNRIGRFSNPAVTWNGFVAGSADANNAAQHNTQAPTTANYESPVNPQAVDNLVICPDWETAPVSISPGMRTVFLDLEGLSATYTVKGFDFYLSSGAQSCGVYYKSGSAVGFEVNQSDWTAAVTNYVPPNIGSNERYYIPANFLVAQGQTVGVALTCASTSSIRTRPVSTVTDTQGGVRLTTRGATTGFFSGTVRADRQFSTCVLGNGVPGTSSSGISSTTANPGTPPEVTSGAAAASVSVWVSAAAVLAVVLAPRFA